MSISPLTLTQDDVKTIVDILNRGHNCEIKTEKDRVVILEIKKHLIAKKPIL